MKLEELKEWLDNNYAEENKNSEIYVAQWSCDESPLTKIVIENENIILDIEK